MVQAVVQSLNGRETVTCFDVIEVDDFYLEPFGDGIVNHIRTSARHCDKYFPLHHSSADCVLPRRQGSKLVRLGWRTRVSALHSLCYVTTYIFSPSTRP